MKSLLLTYCFVITGISFAQSAKVVLTISPTNVEIGESFVISITSNVQGDVEIENLPGSFVQDYSIQQGHYPEMDHNTGKVSTIYFVSYSGVITKSGDYTVGPAFVKNGNKVYKSNSVKMKVGKQVAMSSGQISANQLSDPAFGVIEVNKKEIYEGEPIVLAAKIYSHYEPTNIGGYISYPINSAVIKNPIGNNSSIQVNPETIKGKNLYAFTYDKNVVFPDGVGKFQVDPFKLKLYQGYKSYPITSSSLTINIKPLPANPPADFIGAVGDFRVSRTIDSNSIKQGDVIKMVVVISGIGNLQNISKPKLSLPSGFVIYGDPVVNENLVIGIHGAEGEVSFEYNIQVNKFGKIQLPETSISYFDPEKEKYVKSSSSTNIIVVEQNKHYVAQNDDIEVKQDDDIVERDLTLRDQSEIYVEKTFYGGPLFWTGITLPIFASLFFLLFAKKREQNSDEIEHKKAKRNKKAEAQELLESLNAISILDDADRFYFTVESAIRKAFEVKMNITNDRIPTKLEILDYCDQQNLTDLKEKVHHVFGVCEQSRFGFGALEDESAQIKRNVTEIIEQIS